MTTPVRTRFAPSPTGNLHIGGARTALFAYLWAKKNNGQFLLRIEDTDRAREQEQSWHSLYFGLKWLGITWDEGLSDPDTKESTGPYGPYIQSQRMETYAKYAQELVDKGGAYYCFCTPDRLERMRGEQQAKKLPPRYDRLCRTLSAEQVASKRAAGERAVIRLSVPLSGDIVVNDVLRGNITFHLQDVDDQVLMKPDGMPTYHLANVIDDHLMHITHVIRGEEWLPSTPKHVLLYQLFGWDAPVFVHLTVFLSKNGGKMSKRDGETSLFSFRDAGYLPEAIVNGVALLGWNPKTTEEIFSMQELIERFDLSMINTANPVFDTDKLRWVNQQYMKKLSSAEALYHFRALADSTGPEYSERYSAYVDWLSDKDEATQARLWAQSAERESMLWDIVTSWEVVMKPGVVDPLKLVWKKSTAEATKIVLNELIPVIEAIPLTDFIAEKIEVRVREWIASRGLGNGDVLWPMRYGLSGQEKSQPPFELAEIIGKEETIERLRKAVTTL